MPELPEVETTKRGILPHLKETRIQAVIIRNYSLRWPVQTDLAEILHHQQIHDVRRRAKYLLLDLDSGTLLIHLGMSGSLRILTADIAPEKHDHIDWLLDNGKVMRFKDPRRFGSVQFCQSDIQLHPLFASLGPEPLENEFSDDYFSNSCKGRKRSIKQHIMDHHIVVGVGNIYACEALFLSGIHPKTVTGKLSRKRLKILTEYIVKVLKRAIDNGGTTLKDFSKADGKPGYFAQQLNVYGRTNEPCPVCKTPIKKITQGQRSTFYCPRCQK